MPLLPEYLSYLQLFTDSHLHPSRYRIPNCPNANDVHLSVIVRCVCRTFPFEQVHPSAPVQVYWPCLIQVLADICSMMYCTSIHKPNLNQIFHRRKRLFCIVYFDWLPEIRRVIHFLCFYPCYVSWFFYCYRWDNYLSISVTHTPRVVVVFFVSICSLVSVENPYRGIIFLRVSGIICILLGTLRTFFFTLCHFIYFAIFHVILYHSFYIWFITFLRLIIFEFNEAIKVSFV